MSITGTLAGDGEGADVLGRLQVVAVVDDHRGEGVVELDLEGHGLVVLLVVVVVVEGVGAANNLLLGVETKAKGFLTFFERLETPSGSPSWINSSQLWGGYWHSKVFAKLIIVKNFMTNMVVNMVLKVNEGAK
jgi:hypothetical protein